MMRCSPQLWRLTAILLGAGMTLLVTVPPVGAQLANSAWPMLQHDERHTGRSHLLGPNFSSGAPAAEDVAVWNGFDKVKSSPTIAPDGTIYVGVGWSVCAINPNAVSGVLPYEWESSAPPQTPQPLCRRLVADASASSAAIGADGTLYIGDRGNAVNAFDPAGNLLWLYSHGHEGDIRTSVTIGPESSPGANDGLLYVGFSQNLDGPGSLAALYSGSPPPGGNRLKWTYTGGNFVNTSSPALDNNVVYFGDIVGFLHAVNADTGEFLWKLKIGNQISASPVIVRSEGVEGSFHPGRIYVGSTNGLSAVNPDGTLDATFAAPTGTFATDGMVDQTPALAADGTIYAGSKSAKRKTFYAINPDGTQKWVFGPVQTDADNAAFAVVSREGTIYVAIGKTVYALRPVDGTVLWSYTVPMNIISFPAIGGNATPDTAGIATLYVPSYDGNVYALSSDRGPQNGSNSPPTIAQATARTNNTSVNFGPGQSMTVVSGQHIVFSGDGSDPDNDPLTFTWDFGDGSPTSVGTSVLHTYAAPLPPSCVPAAPPAAPTSRTCTAKLTVTDGGIGTAQVSIQITVTLSAGAFSVTDDFGRANSTNLGVTSVGSAPWSEVGGDKFSITAFELRNTQATGNHIAVLPSVTGPTQNNVAADFSSVDNQGAPKMGIVLRNNAGGYYLAYRKIGPASFLRIAKVVINVDGRATETVLDQVALPSPQLNTPFRLSASAVGTTVSLSLNGVLKLSVDDLTFSAGSVGVLVDPGTSATAMHRVDNFAANVQ